MMRGVDVGHHHLDRLRQKDTQIKQLPIEMDLALGDARHIEQIIDQSGQVHDLTLNEVGNPRQVGFVHTAFMQQVGGYEQGRHGISQFMCECRQKFCFATVGQLQGFTPFTNRIFKSSALRHVTADGGYKFHFPGLRV
jgi:hypothetical protein